MRGRYSPKTVAQNALFRMGYVIRRLDNEERSALLQFQRPDARIVDDVFGTRISRLDELRQRYAEVDSPASAHSVWGLRKSRGNLVHTGLAGIDLARFRASGSYVWNYYGPAMSELARLKYHVFHQAVAAADSRGLLRILDEDGAFGCPTVQVAGSGAISRDLLDSVAEINFLQRYVDVLDRDDVRVLDIGAGYGRLAHRMLEANPKMTGYTCVDAVPESTFLCEFYLDQRGLTDRAEVVAFDEVDERLREHSPGHFDVAVNVHSFSECTYDAVVWWMSRVRELRVPNLMIVPNPNERFRSDDERFITSERNGTSRNYLPVLTDLGYELIDRAPVVDERTRSLLGVEDVMFMFRLSS